VKDLKWYENSREQRWRKGELERVLRKRFKATQAMDEEVMIKRLAGELLSSTYFLEEEAKAMLNPYNQMDSEVAEAGAQVIVHKLKESKARGKELGEELSQDSAEVRGRAGPPRTLGGVSSSDMNGSHTQHILNSHRPNMRIDHHFRSADQWSDVQESSAIEDGAAPYANTERQPHQAHFAEPSPRLLAQGQEVEASLSDMRSLLMDAMKGQQQTDASPEKFRGLYKLHGTQETVSAGPDGKAKESQTTQSNLASTMTKGARPGNTFYLAAKNTYSDAYLLLLEKERSIRGGEEEWVQRVVEGMDEIVKDVDEGSATSKDLTAAQAGPKKGARTRPNLLNRRKVDLKERKKAPANGGLRPELGSEDERLEQGIDQYVEKMRIEIKKKRE